MARFSFRLVMLVEECIALMAGIRNGLLVPRASFFQIKNVGDAIAAGDPQWLTQHEDVIILRLGQPQDSADTEPVGVNAHTDHWLDAFTPARVDRRAHPAHPGHANPGRSAPDTRPYPGRDTERTADPCPPYPHPIAGAVRPDTTTHRRHTDPDGPCPPTGTPDTAGSR
ncbi:hypothetical protein GCM10010166_09060 [Couchioplanes caeruleus subsp. azureus]|nr:hypothetical protein GCM10010166_09060 [Couchioplanes caeruleus subsp. azureus]